MNQAQARRRIWQRLAATARADVDIGDWVYDEDGCCEADRRRLLKACVQVARSIEKRVAKMASLLPGNGAGEQVPK